MFSWHIAIFCLLLVTGTLGYAGIASVAEGLAQFLFIVFLIIFVFAVVFRTEEEVDVLGK